MASVKKDSEDKRCDVAEWYGGWGEGIVESGEEVYDDKPRRKIRK